MWRGSLGLHSCCWGRQREGRHPRISSRDGIRHSTVATKLAPRTGGGDRHRSFWFALSKPSLLSSFFLNTLATPATGPSCLLTAGNAHPIKAIHGRRSEVEQLFAGKPSCGDITSKAGEQAPVPTDDNPCATPCGVDRPIGITSGSHKDLKTVAVAQKSILVCIILRMFGFASLYSSPSEFHLFVEIALYCVSAVGAVSVFILAKKVGLGIIYGIVALIPYIGLLSLLVVNQKATKILRANGHEVGLLGADTAKF
jgi:hypothetical protein